MIEFLEWFNALCVGITLACLVFCVKLLRRRGDALSSSISHVVETNDDIIKTLQKHESRIIELAARVAELECRGGDLETPGSGSEARHPDRVEPARAERPLPWPKPGENSIRSY